MTSESEKKIRQMPKGGRKGGSVFPRTNLKDAVTYAKKLVSKTHTSAQAKDVILSGVVGAKGGTGEVKMSALKQYGFLKGDMKDGFTADDLAKKIASAPDEELIPLYRQAVLRPAVFKKLFDTYHGDTVTKSKLKQRAADLNVHPDETGTCVDIYVSGLELAGLVTLEGENAKHLALQEMGASSNVDVNERQDSAQLEARQAGELDQSASQRGTERAAASEAPAASVGGPRAPAQDWDLKSPRAVFNINVTLDSSLDIEKLQRQLELLKRFGAI